MSDGEDEGDEMWAEALVAASKKKKKKMDEKAKNKLERKVARDTQRRDKEELQRMMAEQEVGQEVSKSEQESDRDRLLRSEIEAAQKMANQLWEIVKAGNKLPPALAESTARQAAHWGKSGVSGLERIGMSLSALTADALQNDWRHEHAEISTGTRVDSDSPAITTNTATNTASNIATNTATNTNVNPVASSNTADMKTASASPGDRTITYQMVMKFKKDEEEGHRRRRMEDERIKRESVMAKHFRAPVQPNGTNTSNEASQSDLEIMIAQHEQQVRSQIQDLSFFETKIDGMADILLRQASVPPDACVGHH